VEPSPGADVVVPVSAGVAATGATGATGAAGDVAAEHALNMTATTVARHIVGTRPTLERLLLM